jgi:hypothetical protein
VTPGARRWLLRVVLLLPAFWVLRDTVRLNAGDYVSLVVVPWAVLVAASWLAAGAVLDARRRALRVVAAVVLVVCAWGVLHTGRMATRVVLVPALVVAAGVVAPPLALAAGAVATALAAAEVALRLRPALLPPEARQALPLPPRARLACFFRTPDGCLPADALQVYPPELAFAYRPELDEVLFHPESGFWTLRTDRRGFVNPDPTRLERADVVVLGDSFMQGVLVEPEESFPARLGAHLGRPVLNLGVAGWDAYQYPLVLRRHGLAARPRVVVVGVFGTNDWNARFASYARWRAGRPDADYRDFLDEQARARRPPGAPGLFGLPERLYRRALVPAALGALLDPAMQGVAGRGHDEVVLGGRPVRLRLGAAIRLWRGIDPERLVAEHRDGVAQLERSLGELRGLAAGAGARLLVLYVPTMEEVYLPLVEPGGSLWDGVPRDAILAKLDRLRAVVTSRTRPEELLDLTAPLQDVARRGEALYWIHDPHWNRRGNDAVAAIVARRLTAPGR